VFVERPTHTNIESFRRTRRGEPGLSPRRHALSLERKSTREVAGRTMTGESNDEFRVFVANFADPLTRLAYLLLAGTEIDAARATTDALSRVRRAWRDDGISGAPEVFALDALVAKLPRRDRHPT